MSASITKFFCRFSFAFFCALLSSAAFSAEIDIITTRDLPQFSDDQEVQMLTVELKAGESSPPHRHNAHVLVYVLSGSVIMQVEKSEAVTLVAGQTFYEAPDDIHLQSANASDSQSTKFLVFVIKPKGAPVTIPVQKSVL